MRQAEAGTSRRDFLAACGLSSSAPAIGHAAPAIIEGREIAAPRGAIATEAQEAVRAGARILEAGGNAMDAAAAASLACCLLEPALTDLGGYVFCAVVLDGRSGKVWSLDANSVAPAAAHERMYEVRAPAVGETGLNVNEYGCSVKDDANVLGPLAVAAPGVMGGVGALWERWGRLKWPAILEPSQRSPDEPAWWHRLAEVLKLGWRDRLRYLGDPGRAARTRPGRRSIR